jgi:5-methylcytosine-specific restriction endonuclease McrA
VTKYIMPSGVYKRTKKHKEICAKNSSFKKGFSPWNKNIKYNETQKAKLNLLGLTTSNPWNIGKRWSTDVIEKISNSCMGRDGNSGSFKKGQKSWHSGKVDVYSDETIKKMRDAKLGKYIGENHPNWKGNPIDSSKYSRKRRERERNAVGFHTKKEWEELKEKYNYSCPSCNRKEPEIKLTKDHILPISENGSNEIENIQPLCKRCNSKKSTKSYFYVALKVNIDGLKSQSK